MSCSRFSNTTEAKRRAFWSSLIMPSALTQSLGLVLDVNLANVSSVALDVLQADNASPTLARIRAPMRPFNVMVFMSDRPLSGESFALSSFLPIRTPRHVRRGGSDPSGPQHPDLV